VNGLDSRPARGRLWCGAQFLIWKYNDGLSIIVEI
jgi:hypothetical protein